MNPALIKLIAQFGKWAAEGLIKQAITSTVTKGVTVDLAREIASNPEVYKRLAKMANRRIRSLRKNHMLKSSNAYQNLLTEVLRPQNRKTVSILPNAGKLYGNMHRADYLGNALSLLKFLSSETSTPKGIKSVINKKRLNFINQILKSTETTPDEEVMLKETLMNMSDAEFRRIAKLYEPVINMGSATRAGYGSEESFNLIGSHMLQRMKAVKRSSNQVTSRAFIDSIKKSKKLASLSTGDPVHVGSMSVQEVGRLIGAGEVNPIPLQGMVSSVPVKSSAVPKKITFDAIVKALFK